jgi:hypothetical protein
MQLADFKLLGDTAQLNHVVILEVSFFFAYAPSGENPLAHSGKADLTRPVPNLLGTHGMRCLNFVWKYSNGIAGAYIGFLCDLLMRNLIAVR